MRWSKFSENHEFFQPPFYAIVKLVNSSQVNKWSLSDIATILNLSFQILPVRRTGGMNFCKTSIE
jgi:hypothetical protein